MVYLSQVWLTRVRVMFAEFSLENLEILENSNGHGKVMDDLKLAKSHADIRKCFYQFKSPDFLSFSAKFEHEPWKIKKRQ